MTHRCVVTDEIREQVLRLVRMGWTYTLVAHELHIGVTTVGSICARAGEHSAYTGAHALRGVRRRKRLRDKSAVLNGGIFADNLEPASAEEIEAIVKGSVGVAR